MAKKALTVTLNASVDTTYFVEGFRIGEIHSAQAVSRVAGGKGNNVARVLRLLGVEVTATGLAGGRAGSFLEEYLERLGIHPAFEPIAGESRTCLVFVDRQGRTLTEVREPGPVVSTAEAERFLQRFARLAGEAEVVVLSGSLPPGLPGDFYARLVATARQAGAWVVLDSSGVALREGLTAGPDLVKPNRDELTAWSGGSLESSGQILTAAERMREGGAGAVAVSVGAEGLLYLGPEGSWQLQPPPVPVVNPVGSGDSLIAGLVAGRLEGRSMLEALRLGVACGTANAMTESVASPDRQTVARLEAEIQVQPVHL
ncbi:MAG: 1-phosphofructokinase [Bacillota bacterium]